MGIYRMKPNRMKVIVPLAGPEGEVEKEFNEFKNLIKIYDKPLIKYIADRRPYDLRSAAFLLFRQTNEKYNIAARIKDIFGKHTEMFIIDKITEGAPCSVMEYLESSKIKGDILVDLVDQHLSLGQDFLKFIQKNKSRVKGIIPTFRSKYWKWSYVRLDKDGYVSEVQEKVNPPISPYATAGVYYFSDVKDYLAATRQMIRLDKRVKFNHKFFVSCIYNELPKKSVITYPTNIICPLGSVEGIKSFRQIIW